MVMKSMATEALKSGPGAIKRLFDILEKMPSEDTLKGLATTMNNLYPYLPIIQQALSESNIQRLEQLMGKMPNEQLLNRLLQALPALQRLPDQATLNKLLEKADSLDKLLKQLES